MEPPKNTAARPQQQQQQQQQPQQQQQQPNQDSGSGSGTSGGGPAAEVQDFLSRLLMTGCSLQGGPTASTLARFSSDNLPGTDKWRQLAADAINALPPTIPPDLKRKCGGGASAATGATMYAIGRCKARAEIVARTAKEKLLHLMEAYSAFEVFHRADRSHLQQQQQPQAANRDAAASGQTPVGWDTAILVVLVQAIRQAAMEPGALDDHILSDITRSWRSMFAFLTTADAEEKDRAARRRGALVVLNCLLAILFRIDNLTQARVLVASVEQAELAARGDPRKGVLGPCGHIRSEVTKFLYNQARLKLYFSGGGGSHSADAVTLLGECCARMPPLATLAASSLSQAAVRQNKLRAIFYLCFASICAGLAPDDALVAADPLIMSIVAPIVGAINSGSVARLESTLQSPGIGPVLKTRSVFLHAQQLSMLCVLVVVRRVHAMIAEVGEDSSRIDIACLVRASDLFEKAAEHHDSAAAAASNAAAAASSAAASAADGDAAEDQPPDEGKCLTMTLSLAQLINNGWIKGYVSYEHQTLVLSKSNPFPRRVG